MIATLGIAFEPGSVPTDRAHLSNPEAPRARASDPAVLRGVAHTIGAHHPGNWRRCHAQHYDQPMTGHVFVVHGDLSNLACDAWLVSGNAHRPSKRWFRYLEQHLKAFDPNAHYDYDGHTAILQPRISRRVPVLTDLGGVEGTPVSWYLERAEKFVERASREVHARKPAESRAR